MTHQETVKALQNLGYNDGWVVSDNKIVLWEHDDPQPTEQQLKDALK